MKDEHVEQIMEALNEVFKPLGVDHFDEAIQKAIWGLENLVERLEKLQNVDELRRRLKEQPDPDPAVLQQVLKSLPTAVYAVRRLTANVSREIPHDPGADRIYPFNNNGPKFAKRSGICWLKVCHSRQHIVGSGNDTALAREVFSVSGTNEKTSRECKRIRVPESHRQVRLRLLRCGASPDTATAARSEPAVPAFAHPGDRLSAGHE